LLAIYQTKNTISNSIIIKYNTEEI